MDSTELEQAMRDLEYFHHLRCLPGAWIVLRLDGRSYSKLTASQFDKPFDSRFRDVMHQTCKALLEELQGIYGYTESDLESVAQDLEQWGYVSGLFFFGGMQLSATYRGLVWETKQGFTRMSRFLDDLVAEWETTSVDFKRELHLDTADQKADTGNVYSPMRGRTIHSRRLQRRISRHAGSNTRPTETAL